MANGQKIGGIYVDIGMDITNVEKTLNSLTTIIGRIQSALEDTQLRIDDKAISKAVDSVLELDEQLKNTIGNIQKFTGTLYTGIQRVTKSMQDSTAKVATFGSTYSNSLKTVDGLLKEINRIQADPAFERSSERNRNALALLKKEAVGLRNILGGLDKKLFKDVNMKEALKLPEGQALLGPLKELSNMLGAKIGPQVGHVKNNLKSWGTVNLGEKKLLEMYKTIKGIRVDTKEQQKNWMASRDILLDMNTVLRSAGEYEFLKESSFDDINSKMKDFLSGVNTSQEALQAAKTEIEKTYGVPTRRTFQILDNQVDLLIKRLTLLRDTKGVTAAQRQEIDRHVVSLQNLSGSASAVLNEIVKLDQLSVDIDLKRFASTSKKGADEIFSLNQNLEKSTGYAEHLSGTMTEIFQVLDTGGEAKDLLTQIGIGPEQAKKVEEGGGRIESEYKDFWSDIVDTAKKGEFVVKETVANMFQEAVTDISSVRMDVSQLAPDPKLLKQAIAGPLTEVEGNLKRLETRFITLRDSVEFVNPGDRANIDNFIAGIGALRERLTSTRKEFMASKESAAEFGKSGVGLGLISTLGQLSGELQTVLDGFIEWRKIMGLMQMKQSTGFSGTLEELRQLTNAFRASSVGIKTSWDAMRGVITAGTSQVTKKLQEFRQITAEIPNIGLPGFEEFISINEDLNTLSESVKRNANQWHEWNEELVAITRNTPADWAKERRASLEALSAGLHKGSNEFKKYASDLKQLDTPESAERAYHARINFLHQHMAELQKVLNEELTMYQKHADAIETFFGEAAVQAGRALTQEMKFEPVQTGMEVSEFQEDALRKNAVAIRDLKIQLEELNAQETLGILTEQAYQQQLAKLGEIVGRSVPIFKDQVAEMIRLGLAAGKTSVRLDAVETIINKLAQAQAKKAIFAEQFSEATEKLRLFEEKTRSVAGMLGSLGIGMDASSQKIIDAFEKMDNMVNSTSDDILTMRAAINSANIILGQAESKVGISENAFKALDKTITSLSPKTRDMIKSIRTVDQLREPKYIKAFTEELGRLINEGLIETTEEVRKLHAELEKELKLDASIEAAADRIPRLNKKLDDLNRQLLTTGVSSKLLSDKLKALQQLQSAGGASAAQVRDLKNIEAAMQSLSLQSKNVTELQIAQSAAKLGTVGSKYEIINSKLKVFTNHMNNLVQSLATLTGATVRQTQQEKEMVDNINSRIQTVGHLKTLYESLGAVLYQVQSAQTEGIAVDSDEFTEAAKEIERLAAAIKQFTGIDIDTSKLKELGLEYLVKVLQKAQGQVGVSIDNIREKIQSLSREGEKKLRIELEVSKTATEIDTMREKLEFLIEVQSRGGLSVANLSAQYKIYQDLLARGVITDEERARMIALGQTLDVLKQKFIDIIQVQKDVGKGQSAQIAMGREYDALTGRLGSYKTALSSISGVVDSLTGRTQKLGDTEERFRSLLDATITGEINPYIQQLQLLEKAQTRINTVKELKAGRQFGAAREELKLFKKDIEQLGLTKLWLNTDGIENFEVELKRLRLTANEEVQAIVDNLLNAFAKNKPQMQIEGLDAKRSQDLTELTEKLELYGAQELKGINIAEARQKRIEAVTQAMKLQEAPRAQASKFISDQIKLEEQSIATLGKEIEQRKFAPGLILKQAVEMGKLAKLRKLEATINDESKAGTKEQIQAYRDLDKLTAQLSTQVNKLTGRYKGAQQMINTLISDIKNLILVQIRWYATQNIIFGFTRGVRDLSKFYAELETQVARVTTAIASQYNITQASEQIMQKLRTEMVRTGQAAEDLATIMWELISAGLTHNEAMAGVSHVTNLALAAELDISEATRITAGLFRVFGDNVAEAGSAADKFRYINDRLAATLNQSQVDMNGLISGLGYMINEADAAGLSFEQVLGVLSVLNNRLLLGSKAGRSASRVLTQLTSNAKELAKAFSIDIDFSKPLDLVDVLTKLNKALTEGMYQGQLTAIQFDKLQDIFGQVGKRAAVGLIQNLDELNSTVSALESGQFENLTEAMANLKIETLAVQTDKLTARLKLLLTDAIVPLVYVFEKLVRGANSFADAIGGSAIIKKYGAFAAQLATITILLRGIGKLLVMQLHAPISGGVFDTLAYSADKLKLAFVASFTAISRHIIIVQNRFTRFRWEMGALQAVFKVLTTSMLEFKAGLAGLIGKVNLYGVAIAAVLLSLYGLYKWHKKNEAALETANIKLKESRDAYLETLEAIEAEEDGLRELGTRYMAVVPFTREWTTLREKIKLQYPGMLGYMDAELATTGKLEQSIERWAKLTEKRIKLLETQQELQKASISQLEALSERIDTVTTKMFGMQYLNRTVDDTIRRLGERFGIASKEAKDLAQGMVELVADGKDLPANVNLISLAFKRLDSVLPTLVHLKKRLEGVSETGVIATSDLITAIDTLPKELSDKFDKYDVQVRVKIQADDVKSMIADLQNEIDAQLDAAGKGVSFDKITEEYYGFVNSLSSPANWRFALQNFDDLKTQIAQTREFIDKFAKQTPPVLQQAMERMNTDLATIVKKHMAARAEEILLETDLTKRYRIELDALGDAFNEHQKRFGEATTAYFNGILLEVIRLMRASRQATVEEQRLIDSQLKILFNSLTTAGKIGIKEFTRSDDALVAWFENGKAAAGDASEGIIAAFEEAGKEVENKIDPAVRAIIDTMIDLSESVYDTKEAYESLYNTIAQLGAHGGSAIKTHLEQNQELVQGVMSQLPAHARKMIQQATTVERIEMIKEMKTTMNEIKTAIGELGIVAPTEVKEQIKSEKIQELYNKLKLLSKSYYDTELKLMEDNRKQIAKIINEMGDDRASAIQKTLDMVVAERDLELKYAEKLITAEAKIRAAKELSIKDEKLKEYNELTLAVSRFNEQIEASDAVINDMNTRLKVLKEAQVDFKNALYGDKDSGLIAGLKEAFKTSTAAIKKFTSEDDRELARAFEQLKTDLGVEKAKYVEELKNTFVKQYKLTESVALFHIQNIFKSMVKIGKGDIQEALVDLEQYSIEQLERAEAKSYDLKIQRANADLGINKIFENIRKEDLDSNREYQVAKYQYDQIMFQKENDYFKQRLATNEQFYNNMKALRNRELKELDDYVNAFKSVMSPRQYLKLMTDRIDIQKDVFEDEKAYLEEQLRAYREQRSAMKTEFDKMQNIIATSADAPPPLEYFEQKRVDDLKILLEEAENNIAATNKQINEENLRYITESKNTQNREEMQASEHYVKLIEDKEKFKNTVSKLSAEIKTVEDRARLKQDVDLQRTQSINKLILLEYDQAIRSIVGKRADLLIMEPRQLSEFAIKTIDQVQQIARDQLERNQLKVEADFLIGKFDPSSIKEWETGLSKELIDFGNTVQLKFQQEIDEAVRGGTDPGKAAQYEAMWDDVFTDSFLNAIANTQDRSRAAINDLMDTLPQTLETTAPVLKMDIDIPALEAAGVETQKIFQWSEELRKSGERQKQLLREQLDLQFARKEGLKAEYDVWRKNLTVINEQIADKKASVQLTLKDKDSYSELTEVAKKYHSLLNQQARIQKEGGQDQEKILAKIEAQIAAEEALIVELFKEGMKLNDILKIIQEINELETGRRLAAINLQDRYDSWRDAVAAFLKTGESLSELAKETGSAWDKALLGMTSSLWEFTQQATDWYALMESFTTTFVEGLATGITDSLNAIFVPPEEEIHQARQALKDLEEDKKRMDREIANIEMGGITYDETDRYKELKKDWREINQEIAKARGELDDLGNTSKRVGEAFKKFGIMILETLQKIIVELLLALLIEQMLGWVTTKSTPKSVAGGIGTRWTPRGTYIAKGGIIPGSYTPLFAFEKGGIVPGGFQSLPSTGQGQWLSTLKDTFNTKFLAAGGIAGGPMLGVIGEGGQSEAVVPLPDNRSIPVTFTGEEGGPRSEIKILNVMDPAYVPSMMIENPEVIVNTISDDIRKRGPIFHLIKETSKQR